ncbi:MAG: hypothetical protein QG670_418 [Thermoproteota archaeon]|nr:hypothetical protein [Thermoproteota archaeon]
MDETERVDTIDLIIRVLREHERTFDSLVKHLDSSVDRMDIQRIEAKLHTEKLDNDKIETLVTRIKELENQLEKYKEKIEELEKQTIKIKNNSH